MPKIYKRNCDYCGKYYEKASKYFCSPECFRKSDKSNGFQEGHKRWNHPNCKKNWFKTGHKIHLGRKVKGTHVGFQPREKHWNWKEGKMYHEDGYVYILQPEHPFATKAGYVLQAHLVAEKYLGRHLKPREETHHINEITGDDKPENLYVFDSKGAHRKFHLNPYPLESNLL